MLMTRITLLDSSQEGCLSVTPGRYAVKKYKDILKGSSSLQLQNIPCIRGVKDWKKAVKNPVSSCSSTVQQNTSVFSVYHQSSPEWKLYCAWSWFGLVWMWYVRNSTYSEYYLQWSYRFIHIKVATYVVVRYLPAHVWVISVCTIILSILLVSAPT